jgi:arylsulfatase A-like enzyme
LYLGTTSGTNHQSDKDAVLKKPNILLISIDSLRPDHLSAYGYAKETTPFLTELAGQGMLFRNAFSASNWTGAAVASLLTGRHPTRHGYTNQRYYLDEDVPTLAQMVQAAGYRTACFSNNLYITPQTGLTRGFAQFFYRGIEQAYDSVAAQQSVLSRSWARVKQALPQTIKAVARDTLDLAGGQKSLSRDDGALATEQAVCRWLHDDQDRPFFAFIHYQEPHSPYFPPKPYRNRFFPEGWLQQWRYLEYDHIHYYAGKKSFTRRQMDNFLALYDGEICYLDWRLGRLFDYLRAQLLLEDTVVVVTADHGECFGENGYIWHAFNLYDSLIRVPLIVRYPRWFAQAKTDDSLVQSVDIAATLLDGLGLAAGEGDGRSFLQPCTREAVMVESDAAGKMTTRWLQKRPELAAADFSQYIRDLRCYRTEVAKLIWSGDGQHEFYDLMQDPQETRNRYGADPRSHEYVRQLQKWFSGLQPHQANASQPGFDKDTWEKLKALGYA